MKLALFCHECVLSDAQPDRPTSVQLARDFSYLGTCYKGHEVTGFLRNPHFEILFESGMFALEEGYLREAVFDFAGALEQFYAFYARVVARDFAPAGEVAETFKKTKLSERQLGGMYVAYLVNTGTAFRFDDDKKRKFRNDVVHNGDLPTLAETLDYAKHVYDVILGLVKELFVKPGANAVGAEIEAAAANLADPSLAFSVGQIGCMLNVLMATRPATFDEARTRWRLANMPSSSSA